ncbi:hypothetical protein BaRGS_00015613 [Batillaria attramentaria]|uniref:Uncharacterized protein n=1 Tax=Batillaria attramentaria TaxID=370345 RepID=A0ABD0L1Z4_9CAEN
MDHNEILQPSTNSIKTTFCRLTGQVQMSVSEFTQTVWRKSPGLGCLENIRQSTINPASTILPRSINYTPSLAETRTSPMVLVLRGKQAGIPLRVWMLGDGVCSLVFKWRV